MKKDLNVSLKIQSGSTWIELDDPEGGYELHKDTFSSRSVTHKKSDIESAWLEGTYTKRSLRQNITESVVVYCLGKNHGDAMVKMRKLTNIFDQDRFGMRIQINNFVEYWYCQSADYTIESSQELLVAKQVIVRATVPRLPKARTA